VSRKTALAAILASLVLAGSAQAAAINIGSSLAGDFQLASVAKTSTLSNSALADPGALVSAPVSGALIRWRYQGAVGGPFALRVLRPAADGSYTAVASSPAVVPTSTGEHVYEVAIPIQAGDTIGINATEGSRLGGKAVAEPFGISSWAPALVEGEGRPPTTTQKGIELAFGALLLPAPTVTAVKPARASFEGGVEVTITGADLGFATNVSFGGVPVAFGVDSESQLQARAPGGRVGAADVTVTTVAGASAPFRIEYVACVVPRLKGKTVKQAKKRLKRADCGAPVVVHEAGKGTKSARVLKQTPKPGKRRYPPDKRVTLIVG
jgi:hypothetical protein